MIRFLRAAWQLRVFVVLLSSLTIIMLMNTANVGYSVAAQGTETPIPSPFEPLPEPQEGQFDAQVTAKIDLTAIPILPTIDAYTRSIWAEGLQRGNNPSVFSKIGDCMTATEFYMIPFAKGDYNLAEYTDLQKVIDRYLGAPARTPEAGFDSFSNPGLAAASGFNAAGIFDATWSDPEWCSAEETPLECELRVSKPSIAMVMFGTNDLNSLKPEQFDYYLRSIVVKLINNGSIPVLWTFPNQPQRREVSIQYNQIVVSVAQAYNIPLVNLWLAFEDIPDQGINPKEPTHMTKPPSGKVASFAKEDLAGGYNLHNLFTLQVLELILQQVDPNVLK